MRKTPPPARSDLADRLSAAVLRALIWAVLRLPLRLRLWLMGTLMARVLAPLLGYRKRAEANLAYVWPEMPAAERRRIANAVSDNAGRTIIENFDPAGLMARMADVPLEGDGVAQMLQARAEGRPILLLGGHYGNYFAARAALVARGWEVGVLYRPMSNPHFDEFYRTTMTMGGSPGFEQGRRGTLGLIKLLRDGGVGGIMFDVFDGAGVPIDFLGKPAPTLTSAADIALRTGALVVPFFGVRQPDGVSLRAVFDAPIPHGDPIEMMTEVTRRLEAHILRDPAQWFWVHRRWKPKRQAKYQRKRAAANIGPDDAD